MSYLSGVVVLLVTVVLTDAGGTADAVFSVPVAAVVVLSVLAGLAGIGFARREQYRRWLASALSLPTLLSLLVTFLLYPSIYPATGLTVREAVVSPLALNLVTVIGLPVLLLVLWYFKFLYGVFSGPIVDGSYGP